MIDNLSYVIDLHWYKPDKRFYTEAATFWLMFDYNLDQAWTIFMQKTNTTGW